MQPLSCGDAISPLLSTSDVLQILNIARVTLWRMEKDGLFPKPMVVGRVKRWQREDISAFIAANKAAA